MIDDRMIDDKVIEDKLDFFTGTNILIHIVKQDREWFNCIILSKKDGVYTVDERKFGIMHLFLRDVFSVAEARGGKNVDSITTTTKVD